MKVFQSDAFQTLFVSGNKPMSDERFEMIVELLKHIGICIVLIAAIIHMTFAGIVLTGLVFTGMWIKMLMD